MKIENVKAETASSSRRDSSDSNRESSKESARESTRESTRDSGRESSGGITVTVRSISREGLAARESSRDKEQTKDIKLVSNNYNNSVFTFILGRES